MGWGWGWGRARQRWISILLYLPLSLSLHQKPEPYSLYGRFRVCAETRETSSSTQSWVAIAVPTFWASTMFKMAQLGFVK